MEQKSKIKILLIIVIVIEIIAILILFDENSTLKKEMNNYKYNNNYINNNNNNIKEETDQTETPEQKNEENTIQESDYKNCNSLITNDNYKNVLSGKEEIITEVGNYTIANYLNGTEKELVQYDNNSYQNNDVYVYSYTNIDLDNDNIDELIFYLSNENVALLHSEDDKVYGYKYMPYRAMSNITSDGTIIGSNSASETTFYKIEFNKHNYNEKILAETINNNEKTEYIISNNKVSKEEYDKYTKNIFSKELIKQNNVSCKF